MKGSGCTCVSNRAGTQHAAPLLAVVVLLPLVVGFQPPRAGAAKTLPLFQVIFINVGQGDSILARDGAGFEALIDGGDKAASETILSTLHTIGVDELEVLIASHADRDHIGGLIGVLEAADIPVESALYNGCPDDTGVWAEFEAAVASEGLELAPVRRDGSLAWGGMKAQILNPQPGGACTDDNRASVVIRLALGEIEVLLTGDIDAAVEADLLSLGLPLSAEALKVAHHGSDGSSSAAFLATVRPQAAVISTGPNAYGHPAPAALARLQATGARLLRTDHLGTVTLASDGSTYRMVPSAFYLPVILKPFP